MKLVSQGKVLFPMIFLLAVFVPVTVWSAPANDAPKPEEGAIVIKSDRLEIDEKARTVKFEGHVHATNEHFVMQCERMVVQYVETPADKQKGEESARIQMITATGEVKISRKNGGDATADKAIYYQVDEKLVLTGNPTVKQGTDSVEGSQITLFLREDRSIVEGSPDRKVKAVIFPKEESKNR